MDYTENNSCEDINQITSDNLIGNEVNTLNYSSGKQLYGTDDFADEIEKTREETRQNPEQLDKHLKTIFKEPILNQETQLGKKKQRKKSGRKTKDDKSTGKKHDKNYKDNMRIRLKIQFFNFVISFANSMSCLLIEKNIAKVYFLALIILCEILLFINS